MDGVIESLCNTIVEWLTGMTTSLIDGGLTTYGLLVGHATDLLSKDPAAWSAAGWRMIKTTNVAFVSVGSSLIILFFLIGFCQESLDIKQELRFENALRMFIKLFVAEFFVTQSLTLVQTFFGLVNWLIGAVVPSPASLASTIPKNVADMLADPVKYDIGIGGGALCLIASVIFWVVAIICGGLVAYQAYIRFFKLLLIIPYGSLANSTIAGNHALQQSAVSFWKFALCSILEAVTMILALKLCTTIMKSGTVNIAEGTVGAIFIMLWMVQSIFILLVMVGTVKGASTITQRALGL